MMEASTTAFFWSIDTCACIRKAILNIFHHLIPTFSNNPPIGHCLFNSSSFYQILSFYPKSPPPYIYIYISTNIASSPRPRNRYIIHFTFKNQKRKKKKPQFIEFSSYIGIQTSGLTCSFSAMATEMTTDSDAQSLTHTSVSSFFELIIP